MKRRILTFISVVALTGISVKGFCAPTNEVTAALLGQRVVLENGGSDFAEDIGKGSRQRNAAKGQEYRRHSREEVFYSCRGDVLRWGEIEDYIDLLSKTSPVSLPPHATLEQISNITARARFKQAETAGNQYLQNCLLVSLARERGIVVSEGEVLKAVSNSVRKVRKSCRNDVLAASLNPAGYLYRRQVGYLLVRKYFEQVVVPETEVSSEEVSKEIEDRKREISEAIAYNATLRPRIERYRAEILAGKRDFTETAEAFSECDSSLEGGVLGEFEADECSLLEELRAFVFSASTNEYSEVIETPYSYHFIKILARHYDDEESEETEAKGGRRSASGGRAEAKPTAPTRVKFAHIMLEKHEVGEVPETDAARVLVRNRKAKARMRALQIAFFKRVSSEGDFKCDFKVNIKKRR